MKVYVWKNSGNAYKVKVLLSLLQVPHEEIMVDFRTRRHKAPEHLALNPRGQVPVLVDGDLVLWDSSACMVYLARKYGGEHWLPTPPEQMAEVMNWVAFSGNEMVFGLQFARRGVLRGVWSAGTLEQCNEAGRVALEVLERRLKDHDWLALERPTIADIACFAYAETAPDSGLSLSPYPGISRWLERCKALPGWAQRWAA